MNIGKTLEEELDDILFTKIIRCQVTKRRCQVPIIKISDGLTTNIVAKINKTVTRETNIRYEYR